MFAWETSVVCRYWRAGPDTCWLALDGCGVIAGGEMPDPYYGCAADFDQANRLAREAAHGLLRRLLPQA